MKQKKHKPSTYVASVRHKDKRANIPTKELRDFVKEDEEKPKKVLYPRDPSLDPQLVWKGKDEQDQHPLEVPAVPIYIQEKIHPQAIIEQVRAEARKDAPGQAELFADFNGIKFEDLVDFYRHKDGVNWANRMILGDSLLVMTSLAEKEGLKGKVQCIYFDPPYGINFGSNWQVSTRKRDVKDGKAEDTTRQPEQIRAFRDTWKLGIHSYLAYLRDRLTAARELLTESGSIFVQIGDENVHLVRCVMDEVFGSENAVVSIIVKKKGATTETDPVNDFLLWFAKDREHLRTRRLFLDRPTPEDDTKFNTLISPKGKHVRVKDCEEGEVATLLAEGYKWARVNWPLVSQDPSPRSQDFVWNGKRFQCGKTRHWTYDPETQMERLAIADRLFDGGGESLGGVVYWDDWPFIASSNIWEDVKGEEEAIYVVQTSRKIIERCLLVTTDPGDLVLDPTCGSGTTAYVAEQWGRRWITIDTSRVAIALARTRLMAAKYPYFLLSDSPEGIRREAELTGKVPLEYKTENDIKKGFVYKRVPHVTLKSIANNPDIKEGMTREQIDATIARHAETEYLYDQPYEDGKRIRVTGPFTVESLSPHRVLATDTERPTSEVAGRKDSSVGQFEPMIIENLGKAGVQNRVKNERLTFDRLEPFAGTWLHAVGEYAENGKRRRVAVSIGPEHGTVGPEQVKEAAKEAVQGVGYDLLVVCGFAFDPHVSEEAKRYGKLTVLTARMNPDLAMGDELLKKTGAGNLFMVFGEPDLDVTKKDDKVIVTIKGLDVYDPTTGQIRSNSTADIACWFIDTNYNGESFFVRHAYFTGAGEPYDKLKRALRADIDESAWTALYRTVSLPFEKPKTGKIAIKVINHYGDEVLKLFPLK
ncbi:MAG: site-specific DNA-methyltransferase [Nitrospirae bacterium]|nr:site-specific DNA-methyltransferase [Nitrospirota bacterium]